MITRGIRGGYPGRVLSYTYDKYNIYIYLSISHIYFFIKFSFLIIFHILFVSSYILLLILVTVYYHHIVLLCFSYHVIYHICQAPTHPRRVIGVRHCVELGLFNLYLPFSQIKKKHLHLHYKYHHSGIDVLYTELHYFSIYKTYTYSKNTEIAEAVR